MKSAVLRMVDANGNRAREALRVMEDYARFALDEKELSAELKICRHELRGALEELGMGNAIHCRDTEQDVGTGNKTEREVTRGSLAEVVVAAGKRLSESLRVLEECAKTENPAAAGRIEKLRYRGYTLEQTLNRMAGQAGLQERFGQVRLYVLLSEHLIDELDGGWEQMLDKILAGGAQAVQLREKTLSDGELLLRARVFVKKCRKAGALSIINDRPDIAMLAGADGVHVGQDDMPCAEVRKLVGREMMVGVSTHFIAQAEQAVRDGATYVAAGPMFPTTTKEKHEIAGPEYAREVIEGVSAPVVAIGGIDLANLGELLGVGVRCVAVCSAIISMEDPAGECRKFREKMKQVNVV
jgi:thiamine-phosphate pyrophosphorylase